MKYLLKLIKTYKNRLVLLALTSSISGAGWAVILSLINYSVTSPGQSHSWLSYWFMGLVILILCLEHGHRCLAAKISAHIMKTLRLKLVNHILSSSLVCQEKRGEGELMTILTQDLNAVSSFLLALPYALSSITFILSISIYMTIISGAEIFITSFLLIAFGVLSSLYIAIKNRPTLSRLREKQSHLMAMFKGLMRGFKDLKMNRKAEHNFLNNHIGTAVTDIEALNINTQFRISLSNCFSSGSVYFLITILIFISPSWGQMAPEEILSNVLIVTYFMAPTQYLVGAYPLFINAQISAKRISEVEKEWFDNKEKDLILKPPKIYRKDDSNQLISMKNIVFDHNQTISIGPFDFSIKKNEIVFIAGGNGSGKTTFGKLLCGLYMPRCGEIIWNGNSLIEKDMILYRDQFSALFSDYYIVDSMIDIYPLEFNLNRGMVEGFSNYDLLQSLQLGDLIDNGKLINTSEFSSGQRKRLALFFALVRDNPICFLDEPASDLDPVFKKFFYLKLLPKLKNQGKSIVVVTHDDNYYHQADRLIIFRDGKIISENKNQIMKKNFL